MSKNILIALFLTLVAAAPAGAVDIDNSARQIVVAASDSTNEAVDCFYEQNRYLPECKK